MGKVHGYIELDGIDVYNACLEYLKERKELKRQARNRFVKKEMSKKWFPAKTREEALEREHDVDGFLEWSIGGGYWERLIRSILEQSKTAMNKDLKIFISDDVHDVIGGYIE